MIHPERRRENLKKIEEMDKHDAEQQQPVLNTECMNKKVDTVEVVRCKDCKHGMANDIGQIQCNMTIGDDDIHEQDWFCAYGERKEGR